jgi:hypothetical protein
MSFDNAIRALSYAEAPTLGTAMALIAKHRMDVDAAKRAAELRQLPVAAEGAAEQRAVDKVTAVTEMMRVIDKTA